MDFENFIISDKPYPWTVTKDHPTKWLNGNDDLTVNYKRFEIITKFLKKHVGQSKEMNILDLGVFPGLTPKILNNYYPKQNNIKKIYGLGIGFKDDFIDEMKNNNVDLLEADLDPRISTKKGVCNKINLADESIDLVIFTDVIEHFYDPFYVLKEINRILKIHGGVLLTTDNVSRFFSVVSILKGESNFTPILSSNIFYNGDWRPHFREYSKNELIKLFKWSGFDLEDHEYYEAEFGMFFKEKKNLIKRDFRKFSLKGKIIDNLRKLLINFVPSLRDNQICYFVKKETYSSMDKKAPKLTSSIDEWNHLRNNY